MRHPESDKRPKLGGSDFSITEYNPEKSFEIFALQTLAKLIQAEELVFQQPSGLRILFIWMWVSLLRQGRISASLLLMKSLVVIIQAFGHTGVQVLNMRNFYRNYHILFIYLHFPFLQKTIRLFLVILFCCICKTFILCI